MNYACLCCFLLWFGLVLLDLFRCFDGVLLLVVMLGVFGYLIRLAVFMCVCAIGI